MIGIHLLYKIVSENRYDIFIKLPKEIFIEKAEVDYFEKIYRYTENYKQFPKLSQPETFTDEPLEFYLDAIKDRYILLKYERLKSANLTPKQIEAYLERVLSELKHISLITKNSIVEKTQLADYTKQLFENMKKSLIGKGTLGIPTGFPFIDSHTGGLIKGDLFVLVARPKMGKTYYLLKMIQNISKDNKVLIITNEMTIESMLKRFLYLITKNRTFISFTAIPDDFLLQKSIIELENYNIHFLNGSELKDIKDVYYHIKHFQPDILAIDGAYILPTNRVFKSEWEKATHIIRELRMYAMETNIPIIATYQLNRLSTKAKEIDTEHIAFSDAIAQYSSVIISLSVPKMDKNIEASRFRELKIVANRHGVANVKWLYNFDFYECNFDEVNVFENPEQFVDIEVSEDGQEFDYTTDY
ncbi:MAG: DnaB-like helicase C-terminal domain-containing protein [Candidatus Aenigmatarchaeota archaeon]